jgi:glutamate dehydrogenase/leucine dehydrogenase
MNGKRAIIQGWGNVASAAAYYLAQSGVKIVGIIDRHAGLLDEDGFSFDEIRQLFMLKKGNTLSASKLTPFAEVDQKIWDMGAHIFVPAASSRLITQSHCDRLIQGGLEVISSGANVPFADAEIFYGPIAQYVDQKVAVIPDFIANCGMARVFTYLMSDMPDMSDEGIFKDVSQVIYNALHEVRQQHAASFGITEKAFSIALQKLL